MQFDFVAVEECNEFEECQTFIISFEKSKVFLVEYTKAAFDKGCKNYLILTLYSGIKCWSPKGALNMSYPCPILLLLESE